jgi:DNA polymerase-3 subunit alpha
MICPIHLHSDRSSLDGCATPVEIAARFEQIGAPAGALTDHGVCTGHIDFGKALKAKGIKPIYGLEAYHGTKWSGWKGNERDNPHLILLAITDQGLKNLWTIQHNSAQPERFRFFPRLSWDDLEKYNEGIIATSACALGKVTQEMIQGEYESLNRYLDIFRDRFYIALSTYDHTKHFEDAGLTQEDINHGLVNVGQERGIPFVYEDDAHYAFPEQYEFHDAYVVGSTGKTKKGEPDQTIYTPVEERKMWHPQCLYIKDEEDVRERLNYLPDDVVDEAIANSAHIGEIADADFPEVKRHLPVFVPKDCPFPEAEGFDDAADLFAHLVVEGIKKRYPAASQEVWDRALRETEVFLDAGLHHYFLMAWDLNLFCDAEELPEAVKRAIPDRDEPILRGPGRGSAAGCIVAYALGLTDVDPLLYGLIFERFWNAGRAKGFPDIDSDFATLSRSLIVQKYLPWRWGKDRVFPIGTTMRMKPLAAIQRLRGAYDMSYSDEAELKAIVNNVPNIKILGSDSIAWSKESDPDYVHTGRARTIYVEDHVGEDIKKWVGKDEKRAKYVRGCAYLTNRVAGYGIHPSGVLMLDESAIGLIPMNLRGPKDDRRVVTEFTMDEIDSLMMIKLDVLGLKTLDTLAAWEKLVNIPGWSWSGLDENEYPDEMWELLDKKFTAGIFQVEQGLARQFLADFKCRSVEELAIAGSIIRPGPNQSMDSFLIRRNGGEDDEFDGRKVPMLKPILEPTYGWFLYQEQVIAFFSALGYDLGEADAVRKILGKKKPEDLMALLDGLGSWEIDVNSERAIIQPVDAEGMPDGEPFRVENRGYREVAYPQLGKETADEIWEKLEDFARYSFNKSHSVCYAVIGFRALLAKYYAPAEFYAACIATVDDSNKAKLIPTYATEARRLGIHVYPPDILNSESHVVVREGNIYIGFSEVKGVKAGGDVIVALRDAGYDISTPEKLWDILEDDAKELTKAKAAAKRAGKPWEGREKSLKQQLNSGKIQALLDVGAWDSLGENERSLSEKQKAEKEYLGVILTDDSGQVLANHQDEIEEVCDSYHEALNGVESGDKFKLPGVVVDIRDVKSRASGKAMGIITIEYEGDTLEFATSPQSWKSHKFLWKERACGIFEVKKSDRGYNFESGSKIS